MKSWLIFLFGFLTCIGLILIVLGIIGFYNPQEVQPVANASLSIEISVPTPQECKNLDLILTSECLEKNVSGFFNYTVRDDVDRTLQDIKANGGDCYDYNLLYKKWLKDLGFQAELIPFVLNNETSHIVTLAYTHNAYCILDQTVHPSCVILGEEAQ